METLFISYKYPPSIGGMQKQSYHLIEGHSKYRNTHRIVYDQKTSLIIFFMSLLWKVPKLLKKNPQIQTIHFNDGVCATLCLWMRLLRNKKISVTYHGLDLVFPNVIYQKLLLPLVRSFDGIITVSDYTKEQCIARGFDKNKIHVIKNGVDHHISPIDISRVPKKVIDSIDKEKKVIVAIGRTVKRKGFVWFVKNVLSLLPDEYTFHLIGPEPKQNTLTKTIFKLIPRLLKKQIELLFGLSTEHAELKQLAEHAEFINRFIWHKNVDDNSKNYIVSHSDIMIMPNVKVEGDMEGFGLVALEANMYNKPVIASELEGITSAIIDGQNGLLIPSEDVQAWYTAITERVHDYNWNTRDFVIKNFSWYRMVEGYRNLFISLTSITKKKTQSPKQHQSLKTSIN